MISVICYPFCKLGITIPQNFSLKWSAPNCSNPAGSESKIPIPGGSINDVPVQPYLELCLYSPTNVNKVVFQANNT